jgi:hypothetical protein
VELQAFAGNGFERAGLKLESQSRNRAVLEETMATMRLDEARGLLMQALRQGGWNQVDQIMRVVGDLKARAQGIDPNQRPSYYGGLQFLDTGDRSVLVEVIWSLIVQGILVPGIDDSNQGYPFLRLTEYGRRCVDEDRILPHDPDGYLREFNGAVPRADSTVVEYLTESLQCYIHGLNRAAAVMLGAASEQMVLLLIAAGIASVADPVEKQKFAREIDKAQSIFRKYGVFEKHLARVRGRLTRELSENLDSLVRGVFDLIRSSRNDAGHPASGAQVGRDAIYSHLRLFIPYCQRMHGLTGWFEVNRT